MADELYLYEAWVYSTLSNDATLTALLGTYTDPTGVEAGPSIFSGKIERGATFPAVLFKFLPYVGESDLYVNGANRVWTKGLYEVKAVYERTDYEGLQAIVDRLDTLLTVKEAITVTGGNIMQSIRSGLTRSPEYDPATNQSFRSVGARWDVITQATS